MSKIKVVLTSVGGLVSPGMIQTLKKENKEFYIIGIDARESAIGFHFSDKYYVVPSGNSSGYIDKLLEICETNDVDVVVPCSDEELLVISKEKKKFEKKGIATLCGDFKTVSTANDKGSMLVFLQGKKIPIPKFYIPTNFEDLRNAAKKLDYPNKQLVIKPRLARGGRGLVFLSEKINIFNERDRIIYKLDHLINILEQHNKFPDIVLMEYLPGDEYSVDALAYHGNPIYVVPRRRIKAIRGPSQVGKIIQNDEVMDMVIKIIKVFKFHLNVNIQLKYSSGYQKRPLVYEINPRISGTIAANAAAGINLLYFGIKLALNSEKFPEKKLRETEMIRYLKEFYIYGDTEFPSI